MSAADPIHLGISADDIGRIESALSQCSLAINYARPGDWGIAYIVCGAIAGRTSENRFVYLAPYLSDDPVEHLITDGGDEVYEMLLCREWVANCIDSPDLVEMTLNELKLSGEFSAGQATTLAPYFAMAKALNSPDRGSATMMELTDWAAQSSRGWQSLFFGAGLLICLRYEQQIEAIRRGAIMLGKSYGINFRGLFNSFGS